MKNEIEAESLGQKIRRVRLEKGKQRGRRLSQIELGDAVGVARSTISGIENDHILPGRDTLIAICDFFNLSVDETISRFLNASENKRNIPSDILDSIIALSPHHQNMVFDLIRSLRIGESKE